MNLANRLTVLRIILIPIFIFLLISGVFEENMSRLLATGVFVVASLTDWLDGYIARKMNMITDIGKFLDPLADKLLVSSALICLVQLTLLPAWFVILIISREFIISGLRAVAATKNIVMAANFYGKLKTVFQMIMIIYVMLFFYPISSGGATVAIYYVLLAVSAALTVISAVIYFLDNIQVLR